MYLKKCLVWMYSFRSSVLHEQAMDRFGSDKPDMRFGMELHDVSEVVKDCEFVVFKGALEAGGTVRGINAEGQGSMPRKKIDKLVEFAKGRSERSCIYCHCRRWKQENLLLRNL